MRRKYAVVILAAGACVRRGRPKQLLPYLGRTLIEHAARTAVASGAHEVIVVVGPDSGAICEKLRGLPVRIVCNRNASEGLGSSVRTGVAAVGPDIECAVIALCDQPRITPELLRSLAKRQILSDSKIVASSYDGIVGAPAAFGVAMFPSLLSLADACGARDLIRRSTDGVEIIDFDGGNVDVDVPTDFRRLIPRATAESPRNAHREPQDARGPPVAFLSI